mgnify:CR=1 FL=1
MRRRGAVFRQQHVAGREDDDADAEPEQLAPPEQKSGGIRDRDPEGDVNRERVDPRCRIPDRRIRSPPLFPDGRDATWSPTLTACSPLPAALASQRLQPSAGSSITVRARQAAARRHGRIRDTVHDAAVPIDEDDVDGEPA